MIDVRMPDEANEGTEASVGRWLRQPGDAVRAHEPLVEINTDKVTIEIAATTSGVLREILLETGTVAEPGALLARIEAGEQPGDETGQENRIVDERSAPTPAVVRSGGNAPATRGGLSPAARRLLGELGLDAADIAKTQRGGRLTPADIAAHLRDGQPAAPAPAARPAAAITGRMVPHTPMRRSIARHMAESVQRAPHVTTVFEADMFAVTQDRERRKSRNEDAPSVTAYLIEAACQAMQAAPEVNSKWHDDGLEIFDAVHFGIGTALPGGGLVVPVLREAQTQSLEALSDALRTLTAKARDGKLTAADMAGGTFTLSNHGVSGSLLAAPIILPEGQAAILGAGKLQRRVMACDNGGRDLFRIRPMMYVTLTIDHRVLDAQGANAFMTAFVAALEAPRA